MLKITPLICICLSLKFKWTHEATLSRNLGQLQKVLPPISTIEVVLNFTLLHDEFNINDIVNWKYDYTPCVKLTTRNSDTNNESPLRRRHVQKLFNIHTKLILISPTFKNYFLQYLSTNELHISQDIVLILSHSDINFSHPFNAEMPNFIPRFAFLLNIKTNLLHVLLPYKSVTLVDAKKNMPTGIKLKWAKFDVTNFDLNIDKRMKNFARSCLSLRGVHLPISSDKKPLCQDSKYLTPWKIRTDVLLVCEFINRLNLSGYIFSSYKTSSFNFDELSKTFTPSDLFPTGNTKEIGFLIPVDRQGLDFRGILGPIGVKVLIWTLSFAIGLTIFLYQIVQAAVQMRTCGKLISFYTSVELVIRPLLDQCLERLPLNEEFFRYALSPWLFYSLIISEMYRGELVSYLVRPPDVGAPTTFR